MELSEHIKTSTVENVVLTRPPPTGRLCVTGTLCVTAHHLLLCDRETGAAHLLLLIRNIDAVEKSVENLGEKAGQRFSRSGQGDRPSGSSGSITIKCKDLTVLQLDIPGMEECLNIASSLETLSSLVSVTQMYPFFYRPPDLSLHDPWGLMSPEQYFISHVQPHTDRWRLTNVNSDYSVCPTYPPTLIVPASICNDTLVTAARFRQGGRFPVLCYYHRTNGVPILRGAQPLLGANKKRCSEDELLLRAVTENMRLGYILDTRSSQQAQQARLTGGGFESKSFYIPWRRLHRSLERGKALQESLVKLAEACRDQQQDMDRWLSRLDGSHWLTHIQNTLGAAGLLAECVEREGCPVLVHGAEGTDTTLLLTTLAQLILDPESRSLQGFLSLLEREWLQAGHPFQQRHAHSALSHARPRLEAPFFMLLLDCVYQLLTQFPLALGFEEKLLRRLAHEAYASDFGTFLCNSDRERFELGVKEKTHCLFQFLLRPGVREEYTNLLYQPNELTIWPSVHPQSLQLWSGMFFSGMDQHVEEARQEMRSLVTKSCRQNHDSP